MINKTFAQITKAAEGQATFTASTDSADRYGDVIDQKSWNLESYKRNSVILLNHRQDMLPIGRAKKVEIVDNQLQIEVEFDMGDQLGAEVARKINQGFLSAVSVGFTPQKSIARSDLPPDHVAYLKSGSGMYFQQCELLEVSVVTIPANSEAVAKSFSIEELALKQMINKMIRSEILSMPDKAVTTLKHILSIEETADTFLVTYAKAENEEEMTEEDMEETDIDEDEEDMEETAMAEDDEKEEKYHDDDEDEKTKNLLTYLLTI